MGRIGPLKHPVFALAGLRSVIAEHTSAEEAMLCRYAQNRHTIVELGVAEGASARAMRESMPVDATLWLVDPYPSGRIPGFNATALVARRHVDSVSRGRVRWVRERSWDAAYHWNGPPVDLLFADGDHSLAGIAKDWSAWSPLMAPEGVFIFHDARDFPGGWVEPSYGPRLLVDRAFRPIRDNPWVIMEEVDSAVVVSRPDQRQTV